MKDQRLLDLIEKQGGIALDIGCGGNKHPGGFVGMDYRPLEGVDIVHNITQFPWPLPDESVIRAVSRHVLEHIPPFSPNQTLIDLIQLLINNGILDEQTTREVLGDWDESTPIFMRFMDEVWRVLKVGAQFAIQVPHALSPGFPQDPTHINMINEITFRYFDPFEPVYGGLFWAIYRPKPWELHYQHFNPQENIEAILVKRSIEEVQENE